MDRQAGSVRLKVSLLALLLLLVSPSSGICIPQGGGSYSLFYRYSRQDSSVSAPVDLNESLFRLNLYQTVPGYGRLFSSTDFSRIGEETSISRFQAGLEGFQAGRWSNTFIAGDTSLRFSNLVEGFPGPYHSLLSAMPPFASLFSPEGGRFVNATYPDIYFRGGLLNSVTERASLTLFGGRLAELSGFQANSYEVTGEDFYGGKLGYRITPDLLAGIGYAEAEVDQDGLHGSSRVFLLDGSYRLNRNIKIIGEFKESRLGLGEEDAGDRAFRIGPVLTLEKARIEANYRYAGPDFFLLNKNLQAERDIEGLFVTTDYRPIDLLAFYSSFDLSRTNLSDDPAQPAVDTAAALLGGYLFHPLYPSLNIRLAITDRRSRDISAVDVDSKTLSASVETAKKFTHLTPYLRVLGERIDDEVSPGNSAETATFTAGVRGNPMPRLHLYLEGEEQIRDADAGGTTASFRTRSGVYLSPLPRLGINADAQYTHTRDKPAGTTLESLSASTGLTLSLPRQYFLTGDIRYTHNSGSGGGLGSTSSFLQAGLSLTKRFDWGIAAQSAHSRAAGPALLSAIGDIEGFVYLDLNQNGVKDEREQGINGIDIFLEDGSSATTGPDGRYRLRNVGVGIHHVRINERGLPVEYNLLTEPIHRVEVTLRTTTEVSFPLLTSGMVQGRVVVDLNGNGLADEGDQPLPSILIYLEGTEWNTFTDGEGHFYLHNLLPGDYLLKLDPVWLPEDVKLVSPDSLPLQLKPGQKISDLFFLARKQERVIIKKVFGESK